MGEADRPTRPLTLSPGATTVDVAFELIFYLPKGRWTSYGELAEAAGRVTGEVLHGWTLSNRLLQRHGAPPWHRLRNKDGVFNGPANATEGSPRLAEERCDNALRAEGCAISGRRADRTRFVSADELLRLAGDPVVVDRLAQARRDDPDLGRRAQERIERRRRDRRW